jgi:predicted nucleic acid-binding protein
MIYADSGIIMRWVEGADVVRGPIDVARRQLPVADRSFITSRIARLECRCKLLREGDTDSLAAYEKFFASNEVEVEEIDALVIEKATDLRATLGLKVPDAIHAATALLVGATQLWTTDAHLERCPGLSVRMFRAV